MRTTMIALVGALLHCIHELETKGGDANIIQEANKALSLALFEASHEASYLSEVMKQARERRNSL